MVVFSAISTHLVEVLNKILMIGMKVGITRGTHLTYILISEYSVEAAGEAR